MHWELRDYKNAINYKDITKDQITVISKGFIYGYSSIGSPILQWNSGSTFHSP